MKWTTPTWRCPPLLAHFAARRPAKGYCMQHKISHNIEKTTLAKVLLSGDASLLPQRGSKLSLSLWSISSFLFWALQSRKPFIEGQGLGLSSVMLRGFSEFCLHIQSSNHPQGPAPEFLSIIVLPYSSSAGSWTAVFSKLRSAGAAGKRETSLAKVVVSAFFFRKTIRRHSPLPSKQWRLRTIIMSHMWSSERFFRDSITPPLQPHLAHRSAHLNGASVEPQLQ